MVDDPIIKLLVPLSDLLMLPKFLWRNKVFNNHVLKLQLICKLVNGIVHVVPLSIKIVTHSI